MEKVYGNTQVAAMQMLHGVELSVMLSKVHKKETLLVEWHDIIGVGCSANV